MLGNQPEDRSSNHFVRGVSEDSCGGSVPTGDDSVEILAEKNVVRRGDDGRELAEMLGVLTQCPLGRSYFCHILDGAQNFAAQAVSRRLELPIAVNPSPRRVGPVDQPLKMKWLPLLQCLLEGLLEGFPILRMD